MLRVSDLKLSETSSWKPDLLAYDDWFVISELDSNCNSCNTKLLIILKSVTGDLNTESRFLCVNCCETIGLSNLSLKHQHVFADRFQLMHEVGFDLISAGFADLLKILGGYAAPTQIKSDARTKASKQKNIREKSVEDYELIRKGEDDAPIPKGYRSVAWIRVYEAHAIKFCHDNQRDHTIKNNEGQIVLECKYYSNDSFEVKKFKSNVQAIRVNGENRRVIGWIRSEEARAVIASDNAKKDVEFPHIRAGKGGLVQYFAEHLEVARKYRSTTRLLRRE